MMSSAAQASPSDDFAEGIRLFSNKEFALAAKALESSYKGEESQRTLFAWAQAKRLQGSCNEAGKLFSIYIAKGANEKQSRVAFEMMQDCTEKNPSNSATPDKIEPDSHITSTNLIVPVVIVKPPDRTETQAPQTNPWYTDVIGLSLVGSGVIGLVASGFIFQSALAIENDKTLKGDESELDSFERRKPISQRRRSLSLVTGIAGGVLLSGGIVYYILRGGSDKESSGLSFRLDSTLSELSYSGQF